MPLIPIPGFCGGSSTVRSPNVNAERTVNLYVESAPGSPKASPTLYGTPGMTPYQVLGGGPGRGLFAQDGRMWAVSGSVLWEVYSNGTSQRRGYMTATDDSVTWACNGSAGHQLMLASGGIVYVQDLISDVFGPVPQANALWPIQSVDFISGYGIALNTDIGAFYTSDPENFLVWDAGNIEQVSAASNNLVRLIANREDLWLFGNVTSSVWGATGDLNTPFAPVPGALIKPFGTAAAFSPCVTGSTITWIGRSSRGHGIVYRANGYDPVPVSNPAVELFLQENAPNLAEAVCFTYQMGFHEWYVITVPGKDTAWQLDSAGDVWTELARWDAVLGAYTQPRAIYHCFAFDRHFVQDRLSGAVSEWSFGTTVDTVVA